MTFPNQDAKFHTFFPKWFYEMPKHIKKTKKMIGVCPPSVLGFYSRKVGQILPAVRFASKDIIANTFDALRVDSEFHHAKPQRCQHKLFRQRTLKTQSLSDPVVKRFICCINIDSLTFVSHRLIQRQWRETLNLLQNLRGWGHCKSIPQCHKYVIR